MTMPNAVKLADVTRSMLLDADCVCAVDPTVPGYYKQVWTLTTADEAEPEREVAGALSPPKTLEVEIDSGDPEDLERLKGKVEEAKGSLLEGMWDLEK